MLFIYLLAGARMYKAPILFLFCFCFFVFVFLFVFFVCFFVLIVFLLSLLTKFSCTHQSDIINIYRFLSISFS